MQTIEELNFTVQELKHEVQSHRELLDVCCSAKAQETRLRTVFLLESLDKKIDSLTDDRDAILKILNYHSKIIYIALGIIAAVEFLGLGEKVRSLF